MELTSSYSINTTNPATLKKCKAIKFVFSTGHTFTKYQGGVEWFTKADGTGMTGRNGKNLIQKMKELAGC